MRISASLYSLQLSSQGLVLLHSVPSTENRGEKHHSDKQKERRNFSFDWKVEEFVCLSPSSIQKICWLEKPQFQQQYCPLVFWLFWPTWPEYQPVRMLVKRNDGQVKRYSFVTMVLCVFLSSSRLRFSIKSVIVPLQVFSEDSKMNTVDPPSCNTSSSFNLKFNFWMRILTVWSQHTEVGCQTFDLLPGS